MSENNSKLIELITPLVTRLGYEIVDLEIHTHRQKMLRIFIDHFSAKPGQAIGVEDCARVSRALDEPLDSIPEVEAIFRGAYELEISSPGIERPLRKLSDFERFTGHEARIHVFRPLTAEELENPAHQQKNPKQKNFLGELKGVENEKVLLALSHDSSEKSLKKAKGKKKAQTDLTTNSVEEVMIPLPLISKANLEPRFDEFEKKGSVES